MPRLKWKGGPDFPSAWSKYGMREPGKEFEATEADAEALVKAGLAEKVGSTTKKRTARKESG